VGVVGPFCLFFFSFFCFCLFVVVWWWGGGGGGGGGGGDAMGANSPLPIIPFNPASRPFFCWLLPLYLLLTAK